MHVLPLTAKWQIMGFRQLPGVNELSPQVSPTKLVTYSCLNTVAPECRLGRLVGKSVDVPSKRLVKHPQRNNTRICSAINQAPMLAEPTLSPTWCLLSPRVFLGSS